MKQIIYKGFMNKYKLNTNSLNIKDDIFSIGDKFSRKIDWEYSKKKKMFYKPINYKTKDGTYKFILFKSKYIIVLFRKIYKPEKGDLSF